MDDRIVRIADEVEKVIIGKRDVVEKVIMAVLADGHILLDDVPGVGKTTLAVALSKALGVKYHRVQFTPDVLPSDIVGFSVYNKESGDFIYMPGIVNDTNLLLADEINRTSSRTQAALLEAMEENQVTVDGKVYHLNKPFIVIATENQVGTAGTQLLPHAQLDRFLVKLTIGYPDMESQKEIIRERQKKEVYSGVNAVTDPRGLMELQDETLNVTMKDEIVDMITALTFASRQSELTELGISPRGAVAVSHMAKACAMVRGRDYCIPEDVFEVFSDVCAHRILPSREARAGQFTAEDVTAKLLGEVEKPYTV